MTKLRIAIVEDEPINCKVIRQMLEMAGYEVSTVSENYHEAVKAFGDIQPDMVLVDINLGGRSDGIALGEYIRQQFAIPFIFITADIQRSTIDRAKITEPDGFLVKPFTQVQLYSTIEIAIYNFTSRQRNMQDEGQVVNQGRLLFLKDGSVFHRVHSNDLYYAESDANYVALHMTDGRKLMIRMTLTEFSEQAGESSLLRIHRSYVVNSKYVQKIDSSELTVNNVKLPMSKTYRDDVVRLLGATG